MRNKNLIIFKFFLLPFFIVLFPACNSESLPPEVGEALKEARDLVETNKTVDSSVAKEKVSEDAKRLQEQSLEELSRLKDLSIAEAARLRSFSEEQSKRLREYSIEQGESLKEQGHKLWESEYGDKVREYSAKVREETSIEYRVEVLKKPLEPQKLQEALEKLGNENWDCFNVESNEDSFTLFCKREPDTRVNLLMYLPLLRLILSPF